MGELLIVLPFAAASVAVAAGAVARWRELRRRLQGPAAERSLTLRAAGGVRSDDGQVADVEAAFDTLRIGLGGRAFLRVRTPGGQTLELFLGHRTDAIEKLAGELRTALVERRAAGDDAVAATIPATRGGPQRWAPR